MTEHTTDCGALTEGYKGLARTLEAALDAANSRLEQERKHSERVTNAVTLMRQDVTKLQDGLDDTRQDIEGLEHTITLKNALIRGQAEEIARLKETLSLTGEHIRGLGEKVFTQKGEIERLVEHKAALMQDLLATSRYANELREDLDWAQKYLTIYAGRDAFLMPTLRSRLNEALERTAPNATRTTDRGTATPSTDGGSAVAA